MTNTTDTATAAEKLQELNAKIDAAMNAKDTPPFTAAQLKKESLQFFELQGGDAADLLNRLDMLEAKAWFK